MGFCLDSTYVNRKLNFIQSTQARLDGQQQKRVYLSRQRIRVELLTDSLLIHRKLTNPIQNTDDIECSNWHTNITVLYLQCDRATPYEKGNRRRSELLVGTWEEKGTENRGAK